MQPQTRWPPCPGAPLELLSQRPPARCCSVRLRRPVALSPSARPSAGAHVVVTGFSCCCCCCCCCCCTAARRLVLFPLSLLSLESIGAGLPCLWRLSCRRRLAALDQPSIVSAPHAPTRRRVAASASASASAPPSTSNSRRSNSGIPDTRSSTMPQWPPRCSPRFSPAPDPAVFLRARPPRPGRLCRAR